MKNDWPVVKKVTENAREQYHVNARYMVEGKWQGERKWFDSKTEANGYALLMRTRRMNLEAGASTDYLSQLATHGESAMDAIRARLQVLEQTSQSKPLNEAVEALLLHKREVERQSARRLSDIRYRLGRFVERIGPERLLCTITNQEIQEFLKGFSNPATHNDYHKEIVMLWRFAAEGARDWVAKPLSSREVLSLKDPKREPVILSPDEAARLMTASIDPRVRTVNALVLFGGIRVEEVEKMDWSRINFATGQIHVPNEIAKTRESRYAMISDNLREWLLPIAKKQGEIVYANHHRRTTQEKRKILMHEYRRTWKRAGLYPWPQDAHRHSFISYHCKLYGLEKTADAGGTSEKIIRSKYRAAVMEKDARAFFAIKPESSGDKIVPFAA